MKVEVEIPDEDAKWLKEIVKVDPEKFVQSMVTMTVGKMKEAALAIKQGVPVTPEGMLRAGMEVSQQLVEESSTEKKEEEPPVG